MAAQVASGANRRLFDERADPAAATSSTQTSMRAALRSEPERLQAEFASISAQIQALSLSNYAVHIQNYHCEENVRDEMAGALHALPTFSGVATALAAEVGTVEGDVARLHGEHTRLRRTLTQHNALLELLESSSVMETCMRAGMWDEALDVSDYATGLYFTHKLWQPSPSSSAVGAGRGDAVIIREIVAEIRSLTADMREALISQLSGRVTLPQALKLLSHLRRLYTQQALARRRSEAHRGASSLHSPSGAADAALQRQLHRSSSGGGGASSSGDLIVPNGVGEGGSPPAPGDSAGGSSAQQGSLLLDATAFSITAEEDAAIVARLRVEFLSARDAWHRAELEAIPRHNGYQYILRVIETQRSGWADVVSQYVAVCNTIRPSPQFSPAPPSAPHSAAATAAAAGAALATDQANSRALLAAWLARRTSWFLRALAAHLHAIDDGANVASLLQQCTYAARRSGRLGADYSHFLPPIFAARARAMFSDRLAAAAAQFREDVCAWAWAYKAGHGSSSSSLAGGDHHASGGTDSAASGAPGAVPLSPPLSLMRYTPLAELVNGYLLAYNAVRPVLPADAGPWVRNETVTLLACAMSALQDAMSSPSSPLASSSSSSSGGAAGGRGGGAPSGGGQLDAEAATALQRFIDVVGAAAGTMAPYLLLAALHLCGGDALALTGFDNAAQTLSTPLDSLLNGSKRLTDARMEAVWLAAREEAADLQRAVAEAARRSAGLQLRI